MMKSIRSYMSGTFNTENKNDYREYSAWCHNCSRPFIYYCSTMEEPDYDCPRCKSNKDVTVP